ncbi:MAG: pitrilysin family protein [Bacilli bacterium]|nr:pitrilysin family protein [Bacilli bacterium]
MEIKKYENIDECVYSFQLPNSLRIKIIPKKGFKKTFVCLGTKYGSLTNKFIPLGGNEFIEVPLGIAHFLEHKLFANEDGTDAMNQFSELGLEANSYTDYVQTVYLFSGSSNIEKGINILLDFVQTPYFTAENIRSEQKIIIQELKMYQDTPNERLHNGLMNNMFKDYPLKYDIGGTIEEISKITKENLYTCYQTFYHPSNMELVITGDVDIDETISNIERNQDKKKFQEEKSIRRHFSEENIEVNIKESNYKMDIVTASLAVGIKLPLHNFSKNEAIVEEMLLKIILSSTIGSSTKFYQNLLDKQLISNDLRYSIYFDGACGYIKITADCFDPSKLRKVLVKKILTLSDINIDLNTFERFKKAVIGSFIKSLNSLEYIATCLLEYDFKNCDIFESLSLLEKLTLNDALKMGKYFKEEAITSFAIYPNTKV